MRPVNLLPEELRPRRRTTEGRGAGHVVIGVLAAMLVLVVVYALTLNQANSHKTEIAQANRDIELARAQVAATDSFGDFHEIKETRVASVKQLAAGRFDWERLMRELALVLPEKTWLLDINASATGKELTSTGGGPSPAPSSTTSSNGAGSQDEDSSNPKLELKGCAVRQPDVAVLLVRLRKLHRVDDVELGESTQEVNDTTAGAQGSTTQGGSESCGNKRFKFDVTVTFTPTQDDQTSAGGKVPAALGGGS